MATIYLFSDQPFPEAELVQDSLKLVKNPLQEVRTWEALENELVGQKQAIVLLNIPVAEIPVMVSRIKHTLKTAACIVLLSNEQRDYQPFTQVDADFLWRPIQPFELLSRVATANRLTELLSTLEETAQQDEVTLLYNRRYFINRLNEEISLSKRHLSPLSCVVLGINFYQIYLDSYGYGFIHQFLKYIASLVQAEVRQEDILARISDDEIGLLLPRSTEKGAKILTDRILHKLNQIQFKDGANEEAITLRAGIAGYPLVDEASADADSLIRYARHALYQARCSKKETVCLFSQIQPTF